MEWLGTVGTIIGILLGLSALGAILVGVGKRRAEHTEDRKDIDGIGRKVEHIRKDLQGQIDKTGDEVVALGREVSEIKATVKATDSKVDQLLTLQLGKGG
jgi:hypothetical protein